MSQSILWGVSGGIALYKVLDPIHELKKRGHRVQVVMTEHASRFVSPMTFEAISGQKVHLDCFESAFLHIELAKKAELFILAPASYNIIGKIASGIADDLLSTVASVLNCRKILAPAMNRNMYENSILGKNLEILSKHGYEIIEPDEGVLACGDEGKGRLSSKVLSSQFLTSEFLSSEFLSGEFLEVILDSKGSGEKLGTEKRKSKCSDFEHPKRHGRFYGKKVLVTAGGTIEKIDPVRYIGNFSSGKMGMGLAEAFRNEGAEVLLVYSQITSRLPRDIASLYVESSMDLLGVLKEKIKDFDILVMASAVSDYSLDCVYSNKIKEKNLTLELRKNPDILKELSSLKKSSQIFIGFSAEDREIIERTERKLQEKGLDLMIANDISDSKIGFGSEENEVTLVFSTGKILPLPRMEKYKLSLEILKEIAKHKPFSEDQKSKGIEFSNEDCGVQGGNQQREGTESNQKILNRISRINHK